MVFTVLVITGFTAILLPQLEVRIAAEAITARNDPLQSIHKATQRTFGSTRSVAVVIRDDELFTPQKLTLIKSAVEQLDALPSTTGTDSLFAYFSATRAGVNRVNAVDAMAASTGLAVLLSFITTFLGFLATTLNNIQLLCEFAVVAATGLAFNFLITTLLVPAVLVLIPARLNRARPQAAADWFEQFARRLFRIVSQHRLMVIAVSLMLALVANFVITPNEDFLERI